MTRTVFAKFSARYVVEIPPGEDGSRESSSVIASFLECDETLDIRETSHEAKDIFIYNFETQGAEPKRVAEFSIEGSFSKSVDVDPRKDYLAKYEIMREIDELYKKVSEKHPGMMRFDSNVDVSFGRAVRPA